MDVPVTLIGPAKLLGFFFLTPQFLTTNSYFFETATNILHDLCILE